MSLLRILLSFSIALLATTPVHACVSGFRPAIISKECTESFSGESTEELRSSLESRKIVCALTDSDIEDVLILFKHRHVAERYSQERFDELRQKLEIAHKRDCQKFNLMKSGNWIGYTYPSGKYNEDTKQCLYARC